MSAESREKKKLIENKMRRNITPRHKMHHIPSTQYVSERERESAQQRLIDCILIVCFKTAKLKRALILSDWKFMSKCWKLRIDQRFDRRMRERETNCFQIDRRSTWLAVFFICAGLSHILQRYAFIFLEFHLNDCCVCVCVFVRSAF